MENMEVNLKEIKKDLKDNPNIVNWKYEKRVLTLEIDPNKSFTYATELVEMHKNDEGFYAIGGTNFLFSRIGNHNTLRSKIDLIADDGEWEWDDWKGFIHGVREYFLNEIVTVEELDDYMSSLTQDTMFNYFQPDYLLTEGYVYQTGYYIDFKFVMELVDKNIIYDDFEKMDIDDILQLELLIKSIDIV